MTFYHFTCRHAAARIDAAGGIIVPQRQIALGGIELSWWTPFARPPRAALGLSSTILACDRMEIRYTRRSVQSIRPWTIVRLELMQRIPRELVERLEAAPGARPAFWYVSDVPLEAYERTEGHA